MADQAPNLADIALGIREDFVAAYGHFAPAEIVDAMILHAEEAYERGRSDALVAAAEAWTELLAVLSTEIGNDAKSARFHEAVNDMAAAVRRG